MGAATIRRSWGAVWVGLALALCLAGCQGLFPQPVYTPPRVPTPQAPPPPPQVAHPTFYVAGNRVNLRAGPGMDFFKLVVLERNEEVEKVGDTADWAQIRVKRDGTIGWVNSRFLSPTPVAAAPEAPPPPTAPESVTPPPLPEIPSTPQPTPVNPPAVEKPPKVAKPGEVTPPAIKKKPEEAAPTRPARPAKPPAEEVPAPEKPAKPARPEKPPAAEPPVLKPTPPEKPAPPAAPEPEAPGKIRIM
jgi:hypothetical protein